MNLSPKSYAAQAKPLPPRKDAAAPMLNLPATTPTNLPWIVPAAQVRWLGPGVAFYTPQRIEQIFRQALSGDLQSQWEMFDLMEATWPRLSKNLNQIKDDTISNEFQVQPFKLKGKDPTPEAEARAAFVEEILWSMNPIPEKDENDFDDTCRDVLDARGKGISILEIAWETRDTSQGPAFAPRCTRWVHPTWYGYEFGPGDSTLKLKTGPMSVYMGSVTANPTAFMDFPPHRFIVGVCKNKTGHPLGAAMLHVLGFWWAASNFTAEWFLNFCQVFGQPIRWATYSASMTPTDQIKLQFALQNMGSQAWAMFPEGTAFELKEAMKAGSDQIQKVMLDVADKACDLVVLRQTLTSDVSKDGGSRAQGEVHERVLGSVELALAKWLCKTLQPLIRSICELNYGDTSECPYLRPAMDDDEDPDTLADTLVKLEQAGFEPTDEAIPELSERLGIEVQRKAVPDPVAPNNFKDSAAPRNDLAAKSAMRTAHLVDELAARQAPEVAAALRSSFSGAVEIIRASKSPEDAQAKLKAFFADWRPNKLVKALEPALQQCAAAGAVEAVKHHPPA